MAKPNGSKLTENQIKFCEEYLVHGIGSLAYKKAYSASSPQDSTARTNASSLLAKANIQKYLKKRREQMAAKLEITKEKVLMAYARRAFFDPRQLLDPETGELIPLHRLPRDVAACVTKLKVKARKTKPGVNDGTGGKSDVEHSIIEVEWDKGDAAREALAKVLGLYEKDNEQKIAGLMTAEDFVRAIRADISGKSLGLPQEQEKEKEKDDR